MSNYRISCRAWNTEHVKFAVIDPVGANCGEITVQTSDVFGFIRRGWRGDIVWNGLMPDDAASHPETYGFTP